MIKKKYMKQFDMISDEELAAYLDGMLSEEDIAKVDYAMDIDTLEVLSVSRQAMHEFTKDNVIELPSWEDISAKSVPICQTCEPLAMAGFLGGNDFDEENIEDIETDNKS